MVAELAGFLKLGEGWDGESAAKPSGPAVLDAIRFIRAIGQQGAILEPTLHVDGSVILEIGEEGEGSLRFKGDGTVLYATGVAGIGIADFDGYTVPQEIRPVFYA